MKMSNGIAFNENGHLENVLLFITKWLLFSITRPCDIQKSYNKLPQGNAISYYLMIIYTNN